MSRCRSVHRGCCPERAAGRLPGAGHGVRGENPLYTPCTPVLPIVREREICLLSWAVPRPPRVAWGVGANLPRPVAGVMSAPAALRPPFGRPGSPSRPRHAASAARGGRGDLAVPRRSAALCFLFFKAKTLYKHHSPPEFASAGLSAFRTRPGLCRAICCPPTSCEIPETPAYPARCQSLDRYQVRLTRHQVYSRATVPARPHMPLHPVADWQGRPC